MPTDRNESVRATALELAMQLSECDSTETALEVALKIEDFITGGDSNRTQPHRVSAVQHAMSVYTRNGLAFSLADLIRDSQAFLAYLNPPTSSAQKAPVVAAELRSEAE